MCNLRFAGSKLTIHMKRILLFLVVLGLFSACGQRQLVEPELPRPVPDDSISFNPPKNIILLIGDGMGIAQITAGMYSNGNQLNLERCKYIGLHIPYSSDNLVTDSAAGATAFACGIKTYNGAIGVDPSKKAVPNIVEQVSAMGMETGLVVTSTITHATPAAFYAHQPRRDMYEAIAADLAASEIDFFVGGGTTDFVGRQDGRNLIDEMRNNGFFLTDSATVSFDKVQIPFDKKFGYFSSPNAPVKASEGRDYLPLATQKAIQYLKRNGGKKGFFLMVEGSQIDWGGHANDSDYIVSEMLDFDKAVGAALDFAEEDGNTLVIITADHETGGYSILPGSEMNKIRPGFTTDSHTASLIPVFAFGPGQELFTGVYENTAIYHKMVRALSLSKKLQP